jgi:hypothetical protein
MKRTGLVVLAVLLLLSGCSKETGNSSMAETEICGQSVGYNALVSDVSKESEPALISEVTSGSVVILQVAPCSRGRLIRLDPADGAGEVVQRVRDSQGLDVGLVIKPALGKTLHVAESTPSGTTLLATIDIEHL